MGGIDGYDWSDLGGNPAPGDPDAVRAMGSRLRDLADSVQVQNRLLRSVGADGESVWVGPAADAFRPHLAKLPGQMDKLTTSYRDAADALDAYWPRLAAAQQLAVAGWHRAQAAKRDAGTARAEVASAATAAGAAADAYNHAVTAAAALPADPTGATALRVSTLQSAYRSASSRLSAANSTLAAAQAGLQAARSMIDSARSEARASARQAAASLHQAGNAGIHNPHHSWFSSIVDDVEGVVGGAVHWAEHNWQVLLPEAALAIDAGEWLSHNWVHVLQDASAVLGGIATVTGFLALVPGVGEILLPVALAASLAATADDAILAGAGYGKWSTVLLDGVGDLGFGAGEGLNFLAKGMNDAEELATAAEDLRSARSALEANVQPSEAAATRWEALGDRQVIQVGRDGSAEVTKSSELATQFREAAAGPRQELDRTTSLLAGKEEALARLPGEGGTAGWRYSLRTFRPGEEGGTLAKVTSFFRNPVDYTDSVLHPASGIAGQSPVGVRQLVANEAHEMWAGAGRVPYRVAVGVGTAGTGLGIYVDQGAWRDVLSGK